MLTLQELINLFILQKDYHALFGDNHGHEFFVKFHEFTVNHSINIEIGRAPPQFSNQPHIPFVIFKPLLAKDDQRPVIIHTHGGPHVRFYGDTPHAEIMYFLSHGYIVVCPNYRGSSDHQHCEEEDAAEYQQFKYYAKYDGDLRVVGAEDVYAVAKYIQQQPFAEANKMTLRGGSYGSSINLFLLVGIQQGKFSPIFNGAHISGCTHFPKAVDVPLDIPLFISHGEQDDVAPYAPAAKFMSDIMEIRKSTGVIIFTAHLGNHHLICPKLEMNQEGSVAFAELSDYLAMAVKFVHGLNRVRTELTASARFFAITTPERARQQICHSLVNRSHALRELKNWGLERYPMPAPIMTMAALSPSELHLKVILGEQYQPDNLACNINHFYTKFFPLGKFHQTAEEHAYFVDMFCELIAEEKALSDSHLVFYHGCNDQIAFVYHFYTLLYRTLNIDDQWQALRVDHEYFHLFGTVKKLHDALAKQYNEIYVNNSPHYNECVVSANLFLFGSHEDANSCSINYLLENKVERAVDLEKLLANLLLPFHVPQALINELLAIFNMHGQSKRGTLFQFALPKATATELAYPAIRGGMENPFQKILNMDELLAKLHDCDLEDTKNIDYIKNLQVRVMTPPRVKLKVKILEGCPTTVAKKQDYQQVLADCVDRIVLTMLTNTDHETPFNRHTPLVRLLSTQLHSQGLITVNLKSDVVLVRAILMRNSNIVQQILLKNPGMLEQPLTLPQGYIKTNSDDYNKRTGKIIPAIDMILNDDEFNLQIIFESVPLQAAIAAINKRLLAKRLLTDQARLLERIPVTHRLACFPGNLVNKDQPDIRNLYAIVRQLPEYVRTDFVTTHIDVITDLNTLLPLLEYLPQDARFSFVSRLEACIVDACELINILIHLSDNEKIILYEKYVHLVNHQNGATGITKLLEIMPASYHQILMDAHYRDIDSYSMSHALGMITPLLRLRYARKLMLQLQYDNFLGDFVSKLNEKNRYSFALEVIELKHLNVNVFAPMLAQIPEGERYPFFVKIAHRLKYECDTRKSIQLLKQKHRLEYANKLRGIFNDCVELAVLSSCLPVGYQFSYLYKNLDKFKDNRCLTSILKQPYLTADNIILLAKVLRPVIKDWFSAGSLVARLPIAQQNDYAYSFINDIHLARFDENNSCVSYMLRYLPLTERVNYLQLSKIEPRTCDNLRDILKVLPEEVRLDYVMKYRHLISGFYDVKNCVDTIPDADKATILLECSHHLTDYSHFVYYLNSSTTRCQEIIEKILPRLSPLNIELPVMRIRGGYLNRSAALAMVSYLKSDADMDALLKAIPSGFYNDVKHAYQQLQAQSTQIRLNA